MQYAILIYETDDDLARREDAGQFAAYMAPYETYVSALREAGVLVGGEVLKRPETATTVRLVKGSRHVEDGPVASTREQLGGFLIIEVPDLDAALDWAERCPSAATGAVEVRPVGMERPA